MATVTMPPAAPPSSESILESRLGVYEKEIRELKDQLGIFKTDAAEAKTGLKKISIELQTSQDACRKLQQENQSLKNKIQTFASDQDNLSKSMENLKLGSDQNKIRAEEAEKLVQSLTSRVSILERERKTKTIEYEKEITQIKNEHAKALGKFKNEQQLLMEERVNTFAKNENSLKAEIQELLKKQGENEIDFKNTIASQAQRIVAYEHQLDTMEKDLQRLKLLNEYGKSARSTQRYDQANLKLQNEILQLKSENMEKTQQITQLLQRLNLIRINQHHDFRNGTSF